MFRLMAADWAKIRRHWLSWILLVLMIVMVMIQVRAKMDRLAQLEASIARDGAPQAPISETDRLEAEWLRQQLRFPASIGYVVRLATESGWFLVILLTAVVSGEDFFRRTLHSILTRGVGRGRYLVAQSLTVWCVSGVGVLTIALLIAATGPYLHAQVAGEPISLTGLADALMIVVRVWISFLPFITTTVFWVVLARQPGMAMGIGILLHSLEFFLMLGAPVAAIPIPSGVEIPWILRIFRFQIRLLSISPGYNAAVFMNWGNPFMMKSIFFTDTMAIDESLLPLVPWRAAAFWAGYTLLPLSWATWILRRRDLTYGR